MILTLSGKPGRGNLLSSPAESFVCAIQRLNVTIISPWAYLGPDPMCIETCCFLKIILMGSELSFLIMEKLCNILKSYRTNFETQVVLKTQKWVSILEPT